ncbi:MAG: flavin reductase family protein [Planctomycetota bacterium]|jgi:flavin reductase (DIM6/NTAB) family NADH-FMN oxidoreductase RutF
MQKKTTYADAIALKYPEPVSIAIARDPQGKYNPITLGWMTIVSGDPPMMAVSIGNTRYSLKAFRAAGEFVLAFPSEHQEQEALFYGTHSGETMDKLAAADAETVPAEVIDCVLLGNAVANFECKIVSELETGDHVVFVGEVICSHRNEETLDRLYTVSKGHVMGGRHRG